ncbi:MAG: hypothetical protein ACHQAX_05100 [Gammaproteobacteria bacterium]
MFSVGFAEILVVVIVAVVVLKPEQMVDALKTFRSLRLQWRSWRAQFDAEQIRLEKEHDLAVRTAVAAKVSDVSDLITPEKKDG